MSTAPPDVPARPAVDPWHARGWSSRRAAGVRVLAVLSALVLLGLPESVASVADQLARQRDVSEHYVRATGAVVPEEGIAYEYAVRFEGSAPGLGRVTVPIRYLEDVKPGDFRTLLVDKVEPTRYILRRDEPHPGLLLVSTALSVTFGVAAAAFALRRASRRTYDAEQVRAVAAPVTAGPRVPVGTPPSGGGRLLLAILPAGVLALSAWGLAAAPHALREHPRTVTVTGTATRGSDGRTALRFQDADGADVQRPLTGAESGLTPGDTKTVTYRVGEPGHLGAATVLATSVLGAALSLLALLRLARGARVRAATRERAVPVPGVAWTRVARERSWLVVLPDGARRPVVVPLSRNVAAPAAFAGEVWTHGPLRPGRVAVVHGPDGAPLWPAGACRSAFAATVLGPDPVPPGYAGA